MTRQELLSNPNIITVGAASIFGTALCYIIVGDENSESIGQYWRTLNNGTGPKQTAHVYMVSDAVAIAQHTDLIELIDPPPAVNNDRILLTYNQVMPHLESIGAKMCRWYDQGIKAWAKKPFGSGYTTNLDEAQEFQVKTAMEKASGSGSFRIEMLDQDEAARIAALPYRKCSIGQVLDSSLIAGMKLQPANPVYRGLILRKTGVMPPDSLKTYEEVKDWVEYNVDPGKHIPLPPRPTAAEPAPATPTLRFELQYSETELGICRYSVRRSGVGDFRFERDDIASAVSDSSNLDEVVENLEATVDDHAYDGDMPDMEWDGDCEYDRHEATDSQDTEWQYAQNSGARTRMVLDYLRATLPYAEQLRLGILMEPAPPDPDAEEEFEPL